MMGSRMSSSSTMLYNTYLTGPALVEEGTVGLPKEVGSVTTGDNVESRLGRLEGAYEHLATKADIQRLEGKIDGLQNRLLLQFIGVAIAIVLATVGLTKLLALVG